MAGQAGEIFDPTHNANWMNTSKQVARELDPTRYIHRNSGTGDGHVYPGWYVGHWRDFQDAPGAPFVTEYGAQGLPVRKNFQRMLPQYGPDAGFAELVQLKEWLDSQNKISPVTKANDQVGHVLLDLNRKEPLEIHSGVDERLGHENRTLRLQKHSTRRKNAAGTAPCPRGLGDLAFPRFPTSRDLR